MTIYNRYQNIFMILGILVFATTLAKLSSRFFSIEGLLFIFLASSMIAYFRWTIVTRQITPEIKGNVKKIHPDDIQRMKPWLFKNIIGQGASIHSVMQIIKRNLEMVDSGRHLGSFLLVGPTGTGKSFFAKLLAEGLYGRGSLLMVAMNQDGLRGEKVVEIILDAIKKDGNKVLLLDEIDKAPLGVQASLYHLIETGQIMDPFTGEWFRCPGLVVIATSNAGSHSKEAALEAAKTTYGLLEHVSAHSSMDKAFLARFDGLFWFGQIAPTDIAQIGLMQVMSYYRQHGVEVNYLCAEAIIDMIKENQRFKEFGVRQLIQVVRHKSDPIISQAKKNGWREIQIVLDGKGNFLPQISRQRIVA
jgi:ATP-dependent Clp protease ATP-binding subunit ClpC